MTIREVLVPALLSAFQDRGLQTVSDGTSLVAEFPTACPEVGKVLIYDDGEEATVLIENITHHHVNPYDESLNTEQRCSWISREVVEFLNELFADRVFLWSIDKGAGGGGWKSPFDGAIPEGFVRELIFSSGPEGLGRPANPCLQSAAAEPELLG